MWLKNSIHPSSSRLWMEHLSRYMFAVRPPNDVSRERQNEIDWKLILIDLLVNNKSRYLLICLFIIHINYKQNQSFCLRFSNFSPAHTVHAHR